MNAFGKKYNIIFFFIFITIFISTVSFHVYSNVNIPKRVLGLPRVPKWDTEFSNWKYRIGVKMKADFPVTDQIVNTSIDFIEKLEQAGVFSHYTAPGQLNQTGLVGMWLFRNATRDDSPQNNHVTIHGATHTIEGRIGKGYSFDGSNDYINTSVSIFGWNEITYTAWIKTPESSIEGIVCSRDGDWQLNGINIDSSGRARIDIRTDNPSDPYSSATDTTGVVDDNKWHFIVGTYNGTYISIYVDGVLKATTDQTGNLNTTDVIKIGWDDLSGTRYFNGIIDEVMIFNRSLTAEEIQEYYDYTSKQPFWDNSSIRISEHTFGGGVRNSNISFLVKTGGVL